MADRTVKVTMIAQVSGYIAGMEKAALATRTTGSEAEKLAQKKAGIQQLGTAFLAIGAVAAAGVFLAVKAFAEFDAKMSQVQTLSHATAGEMDNLRNSALHLGQAIGFSATQVADAEIELVKAGVSVSDIMGGALKGSLELAAAGQIDVGKATEIATIALTQFGLKGKDVPHVADLLAAGADKALGGVGDLGEALKSGGLVAAQFGVSLDETVGTLSAFANAGLLGETAGTDLRQMLLKLANPAKESSDKLKELGISIYGASGQFVGISNLSGQLQDKLSKLTPEARNSALAIIFGSRAIAGANVLYKEGAAGIQGWTNSVNDTGFAAQQAAGKMDNLKGDISKLGAAFNTDIIVAGSGANDTLRSMVQGLTAVVGAIGAVPAPVLSAGLGLTGLVAVFGLVGGAALTIIPKYAALKVAMSDLKISGSGLVNSVGSIGAGVAIAGLAISYFAGLAAKAAQDTSDFKDSLDKASGATTTYTRSLVAKKLAESGAFDAAKDAKVSQKELTDAVLQGGDALDKIKQKFVANNTVMSFFDGKPFDTVGIRAGNAADTVDSLSKSLIEGKKNLSDEAKAADGSASSSLSAADAYKAAADKAATLESNLTTLIDTINKANGVGQDAVSANASYKKALADVTEAVKTAKGGIDESTVAGSANAQMLADLAQKGEDAAAKQFALDGNTTTYTKSLTDNRQAIYDAAIAMGATKDAAGLLADKVAAIPTEKQIQIIADTLPATKLIEQFITAYSGRQISIPLILNTAGAAAALASNKWAPPRSANGNLFAGGTAQAFADGGMQPGIYAGRTGGLYKFAEPETGWEAFISGKPGQNARNRSIWADAGNRLGIQAPSSSSGSAGPINVIVSSKGGIDLLQYVDVQIESAGQSRKVNLSTGMQKVAY